VWAEKVGVGRQISNLYIAELENPWTLKTVQVLLTTPDYDWERVGYWVDEGPAVIKRN
jgi:GH43 family beta-xylosidase